MEQAAVPRLDPAALPLFISIPNPTPSILRLGSMLGNFQLATEMWPHAALS